MDIPSLLHWAVTMASIQASMPSVNIERLMVVGSFAAVDSPLKCLGVLFCGRRESGQQDTTHDRQASEG